uniref:Ovule protein n=1 Tax=Brugia timori TaxID=42155 RepID=A0A0R3Q457_9BILA
LLSRFHVSKSSSSTFPMQNCCESLRNLNRMMGERDEM